MSVWTTRSSDVARDYIVIKHALRGVNIIINGVKFRESYAVVEKNSKTHLGLKKVPVLHGAKEHPITFLRHLKFITRPMDVKIIYGQDVYAKYIAELSKELAKEAVQKKEESEVKHVQEDKLCSFKTIFSGGTELCKEKALDESPSGHCLKHILHDPKLAELGIEVPQFIPKKDKKKVREDVSAQLRKLEKESKV